METEQKMIRVTLVGSHTGCTKRQRATLRGLGLTRRGRSVILRDTEAIRGMIRKVEHLVKVEA
ncbi:MAG: 50S ribosomal protein L30 [Candidatus Dadabacteria bacterium]|nr:MAG: 50S ribosomal protein L30 [Candidatus Dadabacteria bacterium]